MKGVEYLIFGFFVLFLAHLLSRIIFNSWFITKENFKQKERQNGEEKNVTKRRNFGKDASKERSKGI